MFAHGLYIYCNSYGREREREKKKACQERVYPLDDTTRSHYRNEKSDVRRSTYRRNAINLIMIAASFSGL